MVPEVGNYLFTHVGFSKNEKPTLFLQRDSEITPFEPLGRVITLKFDTSTHFCTGWYDMRSGESHVCPDNITVDEKYEQCPACQKRTGFNPAFYHAASVSEQQEERNQEPHFLYLTHFGPGIIKVGISHAARGNARLLEQGARSALILETFPTALVARQYEAKIAAMPGIVETLQLRKKIAALAQFYDTKAAETELRTTRAKIESILNLTFEKNNVMTFNHVYFPNEAPTLTNVHDCGSHNLISGYTTGMLGTLLFCTQQNTPLFLPLKKYVGYRVDLSYEESPISLPAQQTSLF